MDETDIIEKFRAFLEKKGYDTKDQYFLFKQCEDDCYQEINEDFDDEDFDDEDMELEVDDEEDPEELVKEVKEKPKKPIINKPKIKIKEDKNVQQK